MYPFGHFGLAYFYVIILSYFVKEDYTILLVFLVSVLPDFDFLFVPFITHRGPTHSIVVMVLLFFPIYIFFKQGLSYFVAVLSHSLIGDYITAYGVKLFWPLTNEFYLAPRPFQINGYNLVLIEGFLLFLMIIHYVYKNRVILYETTR